MLKYLELSKVNSFFLPKAYDEFVVFEMFLGKCIHLDLIVFICTLHCLQKLFNLFYIHSKSARALFLILESFLSNSRQGW